MVSQLLYLEAEDAGIRSTGIGCCFAKKRAAKKGPE
jgi:hypothetical protein